MVCTEISNIDGKLHAAPLYHEDPAVTNMQLINHTIYSKEQENNSDTIKLPCLIQ